MLFDFSKHTLEEAEDGYIVTLYITEFDSEFANDFSNNDISLSNDTLNRSIIVYIKKHLPNIKISMIKVIMGGVLILTISMTALESSLQIAHATTIYTKEQINEAINQTKLKIIINSKLVNMSQSPFILDGITYVPIREICQQLGANVNWDDEFSHVEITKGNTHLSFKIGDNNCILNNVNTYMPQSIIVNDKVMVSLRFLSEVFNFNVLWNDNLKLAVISSDNNVLTEEKLKTIVNQNQEQQYSEEDFYWLSRLVHAEAQGESYRGKLAVANVIINRTKSNDFPNTIKSVIFDMNNGVQFMPTVNGEIYKEPSNESKQAALDALNGNNNAKSALYFFNPKKSPYNWIAKNRKYAFTIENHNFYF